MTFESIKPYLPYVGYALPFVLGLVSLLVSGKLKGHARETVAAVYRSAIHAASELQDEGLLWLQSVEGIAYRKDLANRGYDLLPARVGPVPIGLLKLIVSREMFTGLVETAFQETVKLSRKLELPAELPPIEAI